ncbi:hypothetical protein F5890DRAFT_1285253 [Lentinula detonsa]|uniref:Uncharacterized protein n=1 Tax=Lentinula detonsa TaxID=2804962 RepID=A0AA38Q0M6_9AGAR|nr:hypothetical protein F5890DRAFT_1285253 [Lentinula detonsa]
MISCHYQLTFVGCVSISLRSKHRSDIYLLPTAHMLSVGAGYCLSDPSLILKTVPTMQVLRDWERLCSKRNHIWWTTFSILHRYVMVWTQQMTGIDVTVFNLLCTFLHLDYLLDCRSDKADNSSKVMLDGDCRLGSSLGFVLPFTSLILNRCSHRSFYFWLESSFYLTVRYSEVLFRQRWLIEARRMLHVLYYTNYRVSRPQDTELEDQEYQEMYDSIGQSLY